MAMGPEHAEAPDKPARQRKSHTKSRKGCGNCKLRRVKCDEGRPQCKRCTNFGVECDYDADAAPALQSRGEGAIVFTSIPHSLGPGLGPEIPRDSLSPEHKDDPLVPMLGLGLALHESAEEYCLTQDDVDILRSFFNRTVFTVGTAQSMDTYRQEMPQLCLQSSPLIHVVLGMTLMHSRYIAATGSWPGEPSPKETFHTYHGTALFSVLLAKEPIREEDKDALWATAALLGCMTIAGIEAKVPEEAWPLQDDRITDLDWLRMSDGKKQVWKVVDPLRPTSVWRKVMNFEGQKDPEPRSNVPELDLLFPWLTSIYDFNPLASKPEEEQDPYHTAASILVRLLELDCNHSTIMYFLSFLGHMDPRFRALLHKKDPRALLLLAWWYGKMCQYNVWWQSRRMVLEGQAICMYLERWHSDRPEIIKLLDYPKVMTGMKQA